MSEQLKPCPFCGNENPLATHDDYIHENGQPMPVVECTNCHTWVRAESWNNRAQSARQLAGENTVPECFRALLEHAQGMTHGTDWNKGTAATYHRDPLCKAVADCIVWLAQPACQVGGDEPKPFCWSYKMSGEQRFYPFDPRQADFGVNMAEFISEVEPLFSRAALAPAAVVIPKTELWQCQNTENSNLVYLPYKPQGPWDCVEYVRRDEVARLNRRAIPVELLERALYHLELSYGDMPTIRELRALLGKDGEAQDD